MGSIGDPAGPASTTTTSPDDEVDEVVIRTDLVRLLAQLHGTSSTEIYRRAIRQYLVEYRPELLRALPEYYKDRAHAAREYLKEGLEKLLAA